jgi:hypothetical protein
MTATGDLPHKKIKNIDIIFMISSWINLFTIQLFLMNCNLLLIIIYNLRLNRYASLVQMQFIPDRTRNCLLKQEISFSLDANWCFSFWIREHHSKWG